MAARIASCVQIFCYFLLTIFIKPFNRFFIIKLELLELLEQVVMRKLCVCVFVRVSRTRIYLRMRRILSSIDSAEWAWAKVWAKGLDCC